MKFLFSRSPWTKVTSILVLAGLIAACGSIVDKDRIRIAKIGDSYITRGDLYRHIRRMAPGERPHINTRGDLLTVLESYIDQELQKRVVADMLTEGKLATPPHEQIAQVFDAQHPEYSLIPENPEQFGMTQADVEAIQHRRERGIEELKQQYLRQTAVAQAVQEAAQSGAITVSEEEYQEEYELRKHELYKPERAAFRALVFPAQSPEAGPDSAEARKRLVRSEPWDEVAQSFVEARKAIPLQTTLADTGQRKFYTFWEQASGTQKGRILGPIIIEDWEMTIPGAEMQAQRASLTGYLVAEILEITPPEQMTLEEAKPHLAPALYYIEFMRGLRDELDVEIYEEHLPEPSLFLDQTDDPLMDIL